MFYQNVQPKAGTGIVSQEAPKPEAPGSPGGGLIGMLPLFLMFIPMLFLMFRKQRKEDQRRASLKKGDRVVSQAGLLGELQEVEDRVAKVKIAPGLTVQMLHSSLSPWEEGTKATAEKK